MNYRYLTTALLIALTSLNLSSCVTDNRPHGTPPRIVDPLRRLSAHAEMGIIQIDDMGELEDYGQVSRVTEKIRTESKKAKLRVFVFVHGWNNNTDEKSYALTRFSKMLQEVGTIEDARDGSKVFGVYVGWRGRTFKSTPIGIDFYHRYQGASRVAMGGGLDTIYEVAAAAKTANKRNLVVLCGHSFGALILETAISGNIRARLAEAHARGQTSIRGEDLIPADLVLLINEAEHGLRARRLISVLREKKLWTKENDTPWLVSIGGEADSTTKNLFPLGVYLGRNVFPFNLFNTSVSGVYRDDEIAPFAGSQKDAASHTVGHFANNFSHDFVKTGRPGLHGQVAAEPGLDDMRTHINGNLKPVQANGDILVRCDTDTYQLVRKPEKTSFNTTPYWVFQVPREVVKGHSDIWNSNMAGLITALAHLRDAKQTASLRHAPPPSGNAPASPPSSSPLMKLQLQGF